MDPSGRVQDKASGPADTQAAEPDSNDAAAGAATASTATPRTTMQYLSTRLNDVTAQFPGAMSLDDFLMRAELALGAHDFRGDNAIALTNLCRDESTGILKQRLDQMFGPNFNINGLGACLTCGCLGAQLANTPNP